MTGPQVVSVGATQTDPQVINAGGGSGASTVTVNVYERDQLTDVAPAPIGPPLVLVKGPDGLLRPRQLDAVDVGAHTHPDPWGDRIRVAVTDPDPDGLDGDAPVGAVHLNAVTGRIYRKEQHA